MKGDGLTEKVAKYTSLVKRYMSVTYREEWDWAEACFILPPLHPCFCDTSQTVSERSVLCVCVCSFETIHPSHFSTLQMAAILLTSTHRSPGNLRRDLPWGTETSMLVCLSFLVSPFFPDLSPSNILEEHWLKLSPPRRNHPSRLRTSHQYLKAGARSLLCLPMRSKTAHQTADKTWVKGNILFIAVNEREGWAIRDRRNLLQFRSWTLNSMSFPFGGV